MPEGMKQHGGRDRPAGGGRNIRRKPPKSTAETLENQAVQPKSAVQDAAVARGKSPSYKRGPGEVPEWSIGTVSKTVVRASVPWVRIPPSPPIPFKISIKYAISGRAGWFLPIILPTFA